MTVAPARALRGLLPAIVVVLGACAGPAARMDSLAVGMGLHRTVVEGTRYPEVVYDNGVSGPGRMLHVYLEGDGLPWAHRFSVSRDPTPRHPLMLRLMALDKAPSVYVARPCYQGYSGQPPCRPWLWTQGRYSPRVVGSMAAVLNKVISAGHYSGLVLMGYSGGGALAMLLAEQLPRTRMVITVAGNLDPDAWTAYHGYTPLDGSLNPSKRPPLPADIVQLHLAGSEDRNVPVRVIKAAAARQRNAHLVVLEGFNHTCCWSSIWPKFLKGLAEGTPRAYLPAGR